MQHPLRGLFLLLATALASCTAEVAPTTLLTSSGPRPLSASEAASLSSSSASFDGRLKLVRVEVADRVVAGSTLHAETTWLVTGELAGRPKPMLSAAVVPSTSAAASITATTVPLKASLTSLEWRRGDVFVVGVDIAVPAAAAAGPARVVVGVVEAGHAFAVDAAAVVGSFAVVADVVVAAGAAVVDDGLPVLEARKVTGEIVVDGALGEADWQRAAKVMLGPYKVGAPAPQWSTSARLLWAKDAVYLAFDVDDDDPFSPYSRRDDPLYDSEALEIFIDADGDRDVYVELQTSPTNQHFDAAFAGGARKNMDRSYNHDVVTAIAARAGGYTQEWRIPIAGLRDVPAGEPRVGARWRINLFRLERRRSGDVVTSTEASAWSAVTANDFHALDRFGALRFVE